MKETFRPALPNRFVSWFFLRLNQPILSRGVNWVIDEESWANWRRIPKNAAYLIASKHAHFNDHFAIAGLAEKVGTHCLYISIPEAFVGYLGIQGWVVRSLGGFPVQRGGTNIHATRYIVECLVKGNQPLVIFPEGELYFLNDVVTPLKIGTALFALEGARARVEAEKLGGTYILPMGLKYVYPQDAAPLLEEKLVHCEKTFYGTPKSGEMFSRIRSLMEGVERNSERRFAFKGEGDTPEKRFFSISRQLIDSLETRAHGKVFSGDLAERGRRLMVHFRENSHERGAALFAIHCLDFLPGYLQSPTQERMMETLRKLERIITGDENPSFPGPKNLYVKVEPPIKIDDYLQMYLDRARKREALEKLTQDLQSTLERSVSSLLALISNPVHCDACG